MLKTIAEIVGCISTIATFIMFLVRPIREKLFGLKDMQEGQKCLLRSEMVRTYYKHLDDKTLREFEFKNVEQCYAAYKSLKGNSFIDKIHSEMNEWTVIQ